MPPANRRTVSPDGYGGWTAGYGGWTAHSPGASRACSRHDTQDEAIRAARRILNNSDGGELVTQGRDGQIRQNDTIPPASDPFPPRG